MAARSIRGVPHRVCVRLGGDAAMSCKHIDTVEKMMQLTGVQLRALDGADVVCVKCKTTKLLMTSEWPQLPKPRVSTTGG
jgi:hypothetical protein